MNTRVFMCDTSSASHPFYTGKTRQIGNEGRASEFASRYGKFGAFKSKQEYSMKVLSSLKSAKNRPGCKIVRRHGVVYVISKTNPHLKLRQGGKRKLTPMKKESGRNFPIRFFSL